MGTLEGQAVQDRYKDLLQVPNTNSGIDSTKRAVEDGEGTASKLELSTTVVNILSGFELNDVSAQTGSVLKHEVGGLEFDASAIADGGMVVGTASGTMAIRASILTAGAAGFLTHEVGGLEFDASAVADGDLIVGTAAGTMALRVGALTAGAAGFLTHEVGGLEIDISAITTDEFIVGQSSGVVAVRTPAQARTHMGAAAVKTGNYTGDGSTSQGITGIGFQVKYVRIWSQTAQADGTALSWLETTDDAVDDNVNGFAAHSNTSGDNTWQTNSIISLDADGFTVDDAAGNANPNASGVLYKFVAMG